MKKILLLAAALASVPSVAFAETTQPVQAATGDVAASDIAAGAMLYGADGRRIGRVYKVDANGNPQIILNSKMVTVPASTVSSVDGKFTSTLSKKEAAAH